MALPSSGQITLNQVNVELGISGTTQRGLGDSTTRTLFDVASGQITMSNGYGKANTFTLNISSHTADVNVSSAATAAGWDGSVELFVNIASSVYCYATSLDATTGQGLLVNTACTVTNSGYIIGKGGRGGGRNWPNHGGTAIRITASGVVVVNNSGAYIAGGGGGGNGSYGGGGAGGGERHYGGGEGAAGQSGADGTNGSAYYNGKGGGTGGGAGGTDSARSTSNQGYGGGGGRIINGTGGAGGSGGVGKGGDGGSGNSIGQGGSGPPGQATVWQRQTSGGGGGWAALGGFENGIDGVGPPWDMAGGNGGAAVIKTTSYSLTNNGTIYGAT